MNEYLSVSDGSIQLSREFIIISTTISTEYNITLNKLTNIQGRYMD